MAQLFEKLTTANPNTGSTHTPVWVNLNQVAAMQEMTGTGGTYTDLRLISGHSITVAENAETISAMSAR